MIGGGVAQHNLAPEFDTFADIYRSGSTQVVWMKLVADLETPVSAMMKIADGEPCLLYTSPSPRD